MRDFCCEFVSEGLTRRCVVFRSGRRQFWGEFDDGVGIGTRVATKTVILIPGTAHHRYEVLIQDERQPDSTRRILTVSSSSRVRCLLLQFVWKHLRCEKFVQTSCTAHEDKHDQLEPQTHLRCRQLPLLSVDDFRPWREGAW